MHHVHIHALMYALQLSSRSLPVSSSISLSAFVAFPPHLAARIDQLSKPACAWAAAQAHNFPPLILPSISTLIGGFCTIERGVSRGGLRLPTHLFTHKCTRCHTTLEARGDAKSMPVLQGGGAAMRQYRCRWRSKAGQGVRMR